MTYLLVIRNALYMKVMEGNLSSSFMIRLFGHEVDEYPKFICKKSSTNTHTIDL